MDSAVLDTSPFLDSGPRLLGVLRVPGFTCARENVDDPLRFFVVVAK